MKTYQKPTTIKLVSNFDKQLMSILLSDLKTMKARKVHAA